jgi:hypothetical protein
MKTLSIKSLMLSNVKFSSPRGLLCFSLCLTVLPFSARAQESWSDSVPRVMKLTRACPLKVRDKNGEWANFKDSLPAGRNVVGAINPRRPDLVFFQLARDSRFMFAAARTCFEGEENWNVLLEEEKQAGFRAPRLAHGYIFTSVDWLVDKAKVKPDSVGGTTTDLKTRIRGACLGGGFESRKSHWFYGGAGCFGLGRAEYRTANIDASAYGDSVMAFYGSGRGTAYYDFLSLPYAVGGEIYAGFSKANFETPLVGYTVQPSFNFTYGAAASWRFYWENATITPKFVFNKFLPSNLGFEIQIAYLFGGR